MELELLHSVQVLAAGVLGGIIGWQRERKGKPAGLRTHALTAMTAALVTLLSKEGFPGADPARLIAGMVAGVGFLGAGTVLKTEIGVVGLTTAASILFVTGIGIAVGTGFYTLATLSTLFGFLLLEMKTLERRLHEK